MGWTFPRLIAAGNDWFDDWCDYDAPRVTSWEQAARGVAKLNGTTWERL